MAPVSPQVAQPVNHQQYELIPPAYASEALVSKVPHLAGVTWVFQDNIRGTLRRVDVPYLQQQSMNQTTSQELSATNAMVLHQPTSNDQQ